MDGFTIFMHLPRSQRCFRASRYFVSPALSTHRLQKARVPKFLLIEFSKPEKQNNVTEKHRHLFRRGGGAFPSPLFLVHPPTTSVASKCPRKKINGAAISPPISRE